MALNDSRACVVTRLILSLKDGGTGGTTVATINTVAATGEYQVDIPEPGIRCTSSSGPYVAITGGVSFVTVFYD